MKIQLWSYNYAPEPTGIAPVSRVVAEALRDLGHEVTVVAAHPHYPEPVWGKRRSPYRDETGGIEVLRLPLWIGRGSGLARARQEASFALAQTAALPFLPKADAVIAVSPCFPALGAAMINAKLKRIPWILWLQDILPDGAISTGLLREGAAARTSRKLERAAYESASAIAVISTRFESNLVAKGVPKEKISVIYNPATRPMEGGASRDFRRADEPPRILAIGNIGHSQNLANVVREFEASEDLRVLGARLIITGTGVAAGEVRDAVTSDRVEMLGVVDESRLDDELARATVGLVSQRADIPEFNLPSKLMNYLGSGLPVVALVGKSSEAASLVELSRSGWVFQNSGFGKPLSEILRDRQALSAASNAANAVARELLDPSATARRFSALAEGVTGRR